MAVKVKNYLERNKVIARSVPEKCPVSQAAWNTQDVLKLGAASQAAEDIFSPNWTWHIWFSCRHCFSGRDVFCAKCHQNWVKDYLQGMQLFTTHNIEAYHVVTAPADWYHGRCTRCPLATNFTFNILINMRGCRLCCSFQPSGSTCIIKITTTAAPWLKWVRHKEKETHKLDARWIPVLVINWMSVLKYQLIIAVVWVTGMPVCWGNPNYAVVVC